MGNRIIHSMLCTGKMDVTGRMILSGPQPVGTKGGAPTWVADVLDDREDITAIVVIRGESGGAIYRRMETD